MCLETSPYRYSWNRDIVSCACIEPCSSQAVSHGATVLAHTMKAGDSHGGGAGPDIKEKD